MRSVGLGAIKFVAGLTPGGDSGDLLPWENAEEFAAMRKKILGTLRPWDPILEKMADEIVMMEWLLERNQSTEIAPMKS